jgi:hypothetical protein
MDRQTRRRVERLKRTCPDANSQDQHVDLAYGIPLLGLLAVAWIAARRLAKKCAGVRLYDVEKDEPAPNSSENIHRLAEVRYASYRRPGNCNRYHAKASLGP